MEIEIRRAILSDAGAIKAIIKDTFDDDVAVEHIQHRLLLSRNLTFVAEKLGVVIGFVDNFLTLSPDYRLRFELDLLAVHPNARGAGVGKRLIDASIQQATMLGVSQLRALVASENRIMQHICHQSNLTQSYDIFSLYVSEPEMNHIQLLKPEPTAHLIHVETLTYTGIWLEGVISRTAINNAYVIAKNNQVHTLGAVVNQTSTSIIDLLQDVRFNYVGQYHWWSFNLRSD